MQPQLYDTTGQTIRRLVGIMAALGIGAGGITVIGASLMIQQIESRSKSTEAARREATSAIELLRDYRGRLERKISHPSIESDDARPDNTDSNFVASCVEQAKAGIAKLATPTTPADARLNRLARSLMQMHATLQTSLALESQLDNAIEKRDEAEPKVRSALARLLSEAEKAEGTLRIQLALHINAMLEGDPDVRSTAFRTLLQELRASHQSSQWQATLGDLALMVEQLAASTDADSLRSLKDNRIRQQLARLKLDSLRLPTNADDPYLDRLHDVQQELFGRGAYDDEQHQTMECGPGGLYPLQMRVIKLRRQKVMSAEQSRRLSAECLRMEQDVLESVADLHAVSARKSIASLRDASYTLYALAAATAVAFMISVWKIQRLVSRAIGAATERSREATEMAKVVTESPNEVYICRQDTLQLVVVNDGACEATGYERHELLGMSLLDLKPRRDVERIREILQPFVQGQAPVLKYQTEHRRKDGACYPVEVTINKAEFHQTPSYVAFVHNLTEIKQLETQLTQAQKLESMGQLAAGIAHEINTPMQCVDGNVEFLKNSYEALFTVVDNYHELLTCSNLPWDERRNRTENILQECHFDFLREQVPAAIEVAATAASRVIEIVRAMKAVSHPGTKERVSTDINLLIRNAVTISRNRWKYVASVEFELDEAPALVDVFPAELTQVMLNLIVNAADAIAESQGEGSDEMGTITIRTVNRNDGLLIEVEDTGCGIPEDVRRRVFDPFFTTKEVGKGTGQGLALAYDIISNRHQGRIALQSTEGVGTTFTIWLPLQGPPSTANDESELASAAMAN